MDRKTVEMLRNSFPRTAASPSQALVFADKYGIELLDAIEGAWDKLDAINETCEAQLLIAVPLSPVADFACEIRAIIDGGTQ